MIRRKDQHNGILILLRDMNRSQTNAGRCIAAHRLTEDILLRNSRKLLNRQLAVILICGNVNVFQIHQR